MKPSTSRMKELRRWLQDLPAQERNNLLTVRDPNAADVLAKMQDMQGHSHPSTACYFHFGDIAQCRSPAHYGEWISVTGQREHNSPSSNSGETANPRAIDASMLRAAPLPSDVQLPQKVLDVSAKLEKIVRVDTFGNIYLPWHSVSLRTQTWQNVKLQADWLDDLMLLAGIDKNVYAKRKLSGTQYFTPASFCASLLLASLLKQHRISVQQSEKLAKSTARGIELPSSRCISDLVGVLQKCKTADLVEKRELICVRKLLKETRKETSGREPINQTHLLPAAERFFGPALTPVAKEAKTSAWGDMDMWDRKWGAFANSNLERAQMSAAPTPPESHSPSQPDSEEDDAEPRPVRVHREACRSRLCRDRVFSLVPCSSPIGDRLDALDHLLEAGYGYGSAGSRWKQPLSSISSFNAVNPTFYSVLDFLFSAPVAHLQMHRQLFSHPSGVWTFENVLRELQTPSRDAGQARDPVIPVKGYQTSFLSNLNNPGGIFSPHKDEDDDFVWTVTDRIQEAQMKFEAQIPGMDFPSPACPYPSVADRAATAHALSSKPIPQKSKQMVSGKYVSNDEPISSFNQSGQHTPSKPASFSADESDDDLSVDTESTKSSETEFSPLRKRSSGAPSRAEVMEAKPKPVSNTNSPSAPKKTWAQAVGGGSTQAVKQAISRSPPSYGGTTAAASVMGIDLTGCVGNKSHKSHSAHSGHSSPTPVPDKVSADNSFNLFAPSHKFEAVAEAQKSTVRRLHAEIDAFLEESQPCKRSERRRTKIVQEIQAAVSSLWENATVETYGSFATDLYLPQSDVDVVVMNTNEEGTKSGLKMLAEKLSGLKWANSVNPIETASVPVIKLVVDTSVWEGEEFQDDSHKCIPVDITFYSRKNQSESSGAGYSPIDCRDFVKQELEKRAIIRPIVLVLKQFLYKHNMNDVYGKGGLSSHSLILLMIYYFNTVKSEDNLPEECERGEWLIRVLHWLSEFPFDHIGIAVGCESHALIPRDEEGLDQLIRQRATPSKETRQILYLEDPFYKDVNVARSSYNWWQVRRHLQGAFYVLTHHSQPGPSQRIFGGVAEMASPLASILDPGTVGPAIDKALKK